MSQKDVLDLIFFVSITFPAETLAVPNDITNSVVLSIDSARLPILFAAIGAWRGH
jgi:hypothetical protein